MPRLPDADACINTTLKEWNSIDIVSRALIDNLHWYERVMLEARL